MAGINDVRYYDSEMTGAPAPGLYGAGKMIALLDACLVNGFNLHPVDQIVVSGGVATATTPDNHGFRDYTVIRVVGCSEPALNGDWKSDVVAGTTFSWPTTVADGTYGGTMSAKTAPLGWTKEFFDTNVAVYRQKDGARHYFRIDDSHPVNALVAGYEGKSDASAAGVGMFPASGVCNLAKNTTADAVRWFLVGDGGTVYLINAPQGGAGDVPQTNGTYILRGFGAFNSYMPADDYSSFVAGAPGSDYLGESAVWGGLNALNGGVGGLTLCRNSALVSPVSARIVGSAFVEGWGSSKNSSLLVGLNPADSSMLFHFPVNIQEASTNSVRGEIPGLWQPINQVFVRRNNVEIVDGRRLLLKQVADVAYYNTYNMGTGTGLVGIDITGPWR